MRKLSQVLLVLHVKPFKEISLVNFQSFGTCSMLKEQTRQKPFFPFLCGQMGLKATSNQIIQHTKATFYLNFSSLPRLFCANLFLLKRSSVDIFSSGLLFLCYFVDLLPSINNLKASLVAIKMILLFRVRGSLVKPPGGYTVTESFTRSSSKVVQFHTFFFVLRSLASVGSSFQKLHVLSFLMTSQMYPDSVVCFASC